MSTVKLYPRKVGIEKGYPVTKLEKIHRSSRNRKAGKHQKLLKEITREITGLAPFEKRMIELIRIGKDKRALKFAKRRVGGHQRGKKKREDMTRFYHEMRRKKD